MEESIGKRLKRLRKEAGLTQAELASKAGVGQSAIGNIEAGTRGYGVTVIKIAKALGTTTGYLQVIENELETVKHLHAEHAPERSYNFHKITGLEEACNTLARYFEDMPEEDRDNAVRWLSGLVHRPSSVPHVIGALMDMATTPKKSTSKTANRAN